MDKNELPEGASVELSDDEQRVFDAVAGDFPELDVTDEKRTEAFRIALSEAFSSASINTEPLANKTIIYYVWCARHGSLFETPGWHTAQYVARQHRIDVLPPHYDIRIVGIDESDRDRGRRKAIA